MAFMNVCTLPGGNCPATCPNRRAVPVELEEEYKQPDGKHITRHPVPFCMSATDCPCMDRVSVDAKKIRGILNKMFAEKLSFCPDPGQINE